MFLLLARLVAAAEDPARAKISAELNMSALQPGSQAVVAVVLDLQPGFHAQSNAPKEGNIATEVVLPDAPPIQAFAPVYPAGKDEFYPSLGTLNVYSGKTIIYVPIEVSSQAAPGTVKIAGNITTQICDDNQCFAPETTPFEVQTEIVAAGAAIQPSHAELFEHFDPSIFSRLQKAVPQGQKILIFGKDLDQAPLAFIFFVSFVVGIIFNVVPCVLPVVPLKAIGFYEVSQHNRAKCLLLGIVFSVGLIATFAVLGLFVLVLQKFSWGEQFSNPYFLGGIVALLAVMGFGMFGAFSVGLPTWVYNITPRHDTYTGNFLFGILTAVLSTPCTFGMFFLLMTWAARQRPAMGMALMTTVGAGMAFPYLVLSAFPNLARKLPRTGPWAELVKQMMGFLLIASAVYFARRFIEQIASDKIFWWSLFAVVLIAGIFLIARATHFGKTKVAPVVASVIALLFVAPSLAVTLRLTNPPIDWKPYSAESLTAARQSGKPVMVEFTAAWCGNCVALETSVFHDERLVDAIKQLDVTPLRADLTKEDAPGWKLLGEISPVKAIPLTAVYGANANDPKKLSGIYSTDEIVGALKDAASNKVSSAQNP